MPQGEKDGKFRIWDLLELTFYLSSVGQVSLSLSL